MAAPLGASSISKVNEDIHSVAGREDRDDQFSDYIILVTDSDEEVEKGNDYYGEGGNRNITASVSLSAQGDRSVQWIPRHGSPMVHRVQKWEVSNQSILRAGEQVEFVDEQGTVIRGTIYGAARDDGTSGMAQVMLDFWQQRERAYRPGCDDAHVLGEHETAAVGQRLGLPAVFHQPVEVGAPPGHQVEERAQPGAVRLTSREVSVREEGYSATNVSDIRSIPASRALRQDWHLRRKHWTMKKMIRLHGRLQSRRLRQAGRRSRAIVLQAARKERFGFRNFWDLKGMRAYFIRMCRPLQRSQASLCNEIKGQESDFPLTANGPTPLHDRPMSRQHFTTDQWTDTASRPMDQHCVSLQTSVRNTKVI
ncbi:hypothetical protein NDU88_003948 [Pleurodeles waltl]|uniref:Uncharacterized protein n=1 Tax=Pleurodeles waltl TaxID=8319 RepID=A0AAV7NIG2_PLEWA|nr:hypothetical protein NDU88_003948 [Pleurodeles waltl]